VQGGAGRPAETILAELDAVPYPSGVESDSTAVLEAFEAEIRRCTERANALALELYEAYPEHAEVPRVLESRWRLARENLGRNELVLRETDEVLAGSPGQELLRTALFERAFSAVEARALPLDEVERMVDAALDGPAWPAGSARPARMLWRLATRRIPTAEGQRTVLERLLRHHRTRDHAIDAALHFRLLERVGAPLELTFDDALTGRPFGREDLLGHETLVVVLRMSPVLPRRRRALAELARLRAEGSAPRIVCVWSTRWEEALPLFRSCAEELGLDCALFLDRGNDAGAWTEQLRPAVTPLYLRVDARGVLDRVSMRPETLLD